jgi:hypothetical protein
MYPGPPGGERFTSRPASLKYGWNAHNYLGFADAWELRGDEGDDQLLHYFEAPDPVRNDANARRLWLDFVRANMGAPDPDCANPTITAQPANSSASLTVSATGAPPLSFEWFEGESGVTSSPVAGGTSPTLLVPVTTPRRFWARVTNRCGSALSSAATISPAAGSGRRRSVRP